MKTCLAYTHSSTSIINATIASSGTTSPVLAGIPTPYPAENECGRVQRSAPAPASAGGERGDKLSPPGALGADCYGLEQGAGCEQRSQSNHWANSKNT